MNTLNMYIDISIGGWGRRKRREGRMRRMMRRSLGKTLDSRVRARGPCSYLEVKCGLIGGGNGLGPSQAAGQQGG